MPSIDLDFDRLFGSREADTSGWGHFGLLQNPFPTRAYPIWDAMHNQEDVRRHFEEELGEFVHFSRSATLLFTGENRCGKTHFMEFYRRQLPRGFVGRNLCMPIVVLSAQYCDFQQFYLQLIAQLDDSLHEQTGAKLFQQEGLPSVPPMGMPGGEFGRALARLQAARDTPDRQSRTASLFQKWLRGDKLSAGQRDELEVTGAVDTVAGMLSAIEGVIKYLRWSGGQGGNPRCPGVLVFVDELEVALLQRRDRRDQFLQNLRALIDACREGLFLCVAMTKSEERRQLLEGSYPALWARLHGNKRRPDLDLLPVERVVDACDYAEAFVRLGRDIARGSLGVNKHPPEPLSDQDVLSRRRIEDLFQDLRSPAPTVSQGDFFDRLHEVAQQVVRARKAGSP